MKKLDSYFKKANRVSSLVLFLTTTFSAGAETKKSETHSFKIFGTVKYRCYAGYSGKKLVDNVSKDPCDNKTSESVLVDKTVPIEMKVEPNPADSDELTGSWLERFEYKGRKFEIAVTLFKESTSPFYRLRLVAEDNEKTSRKSAVFIEMKSIKEMNPLSLSYDSAGKKEEVNFLVRVEPAIQK